MFKKVTIALCFVALVLVTLSQVNLVDAGNNNRPTSPEEKPNRSCEKLLNKIQASFGSTCTITPAGKKPYNPVADLNNDGQINIMDFSLLSANYNNYAWCEQQLGDKTNPCSGPTSPVASLNSQSSSFTGISRFFNSN